MIAEANKGILFYWYLSQLVDAPHMLVTVYDIPYRCHKFLIRLISFLYVTLPLFVHWYLP